MGASNKARLFIGAKVSLATVNALGEAVTELEKHAAEANLKVRWVAPASYHVTLKFIGWTRPEVIDAIRDQVKDIRIGDQIRVRGYLASYSNDGGGKRGTSTTRTDTGDGACETVYVEHFYIVQAATSYWRISMYLSLIVLLAGLVIHFKRPYKPY